jgi:hypothetical protein
MKTLTLVALAMAVTLTAEARLRQECRMECRAAIAACTLSSEIQGALGVPKPKSCKRIIRRRCQREGLVFCSPTTTSTSIATTSTSTTSTTSTTLRPIPPRTSTFNITSDSCSLGPDEAASVTFTVRPQEGVIDFEVLVLQPEYFFCWWVDLVFIQGTHQIGVEFFHTPGKAYLSVGELADNCATYQPGVRLRGQISDFPSIISLTAPFQAHFDETYCRPSWCGMCDVTL